MNIHFQYKGVTVEGEIKQFISKRIDGLEKFFSPDAKTFIDIERTRPSHKGDDLYYVSIRLEDGRFNYFTDDHRENIRKAFDHAYGELFRMVRNERSRTRALARKAGSRIRNIFTKKK